LEGKLNYFFFGVLPNDSATIPELSKLLPRPGLTSVLSSDDVCDLFKFVSPIFHIRKL